jgi:hypothetical protein
VQGILKTTCRTLRERWDAEQAELDSSTVNAYTRASERTSPMEPMPALDASWAAVVNRLTEQIEDEGLDFLFDSDALDEFIAMFEAVRDSAPRILRRAHFPSALEPAIEALLARIDRELDADRSYSDDAGYDSEADASFALTKSLGHLDDIVSPLEKPIKPRIDRLVTNGNRCREEYAERENSKKDDDGSWYEEYKARLSDEALSVESILIDL